MFDIFAVLTLALSISGLKLATARGYMSNLAYILIVVVPIIPLLCLSFIKSRDKEYNIKVHPLVFFLQLVVILFLVFATRLWPALILDLFGLLRVPIILAN